MQYSESNLGIPEERFEYLARIARWLVSDWAAAQGLAPDAFRPLYERVIPRLAVEMHMRTTAELPIDDALRLLREWLPQYGTSGDEASRVLEGIFTRTGILVRDVPGAVVFAQFSLQEYFTATIIVRSHLLQDIIAKGVGAWWRESVLLAVAQLEEPTLTLEELFRRDAALAAEAVAECPTPSVVMQSRAVLTCTSAIDAGDEAAHRATVALLRKIAPAPEADLLQRLANRLGSGDSVASLVGLILAHAGTTNATNLLAARPEVWDSCLQSAGYLSSSFEQVLISVINTGSEVNARKAVKLLVPRLSADRRSQLLAMLRTLPTERAAMLAGLMLRNMDTDPRYGDQDLDLSSISLCAVYLQNLDDLPLRDKMRPAWFGPSVVELAAVLACLRGIRAQKRLAVILNRGIRWYVDRRASIVVISSAVMALSVVWPSRYWYVPAALGAALALLAGFLPVYWPRRALARYARLFRPWDTQAVMTGAGLALLLTGLDVTHFPHNDQRARALAAVIFALPVYAHALYYWRSNGAVDRELTDDFTFEATCSAGHPMAAVIQSQRFEFLFESGAVARHVMFKPGGSV